MIRKRLLSACLALALCLGLLPVTALAAAEGAPSQLYVGNQQVSSGNDITYWTTDTSGGLVSASESDSWNVKYDPTSATLTLSGATIKGDSDVVSIPYGSGIYAQGSSNQPVTLTIELIGENTITGTFGIYVNAEINASSYGTNATLTIMGENNGSLGVSGSNNGIYVKSGTGNASLNIKNVAVTSSTNDNYAAGVYVMSSMHATSSPQLSLKVNGGSLTASASEGNDGIQFYVGSSEATGATTSLTVSDNAIVDAKTGGIKASNPNLNNLSDRIVVGSGTGTNGGIVFDGSTGTVYGTVELQKDLTIGEGESLTLDSGASLNAGGHNVIVDGGTLDDSIKDSLGDSVKYPPTITTNSLPGGTVGTDYSQPLIADGSETITWSITDGSLPAGLSLGADTGVISGTPTAAGTYSFTVTATNDYGSDSKEFTLTIDQQGTIHVTSVSLDKANLELTEGETAQLTATVLPDNTTNKNVTWSTSNASIATVDANGLVTAVSAGTATITVTTEDGSFTANCTVTVREDAPDRPVSIPDTHEIELIAGEGGEAKTNFSNAGAGTKITVAATPDAGYELAYITVDGERISGVSFTMPAHDVTVRVYFSGGALPFADVTEGAWYYDAVSYVCANGLMDGVSASEFAPEANMTRAMLVTILWRLEGEPVVNYLMPFADVDGGAWYAEAVRWAASEGLVEGVSASEFAPDAEITREQLAAILWRYAGEPATAANLAAYTDAESVSEWATDAMLWATQNGIITGTTAATLAPQGAATRAQCAAMLMRFAER